MWIELKMLVSSRKELERGSKAANSSGEGRPMDVSKILSELRAEREQIEEAILSIERLARRRGRRRVRPPSWMSEITTKRRGRPPGSKNKSIVPSSSKSSAVA